MVFMGLLSNNECYGKEIVQQKNNINLRVRNFYGNMSNKKGIILKWSKVPKSKGYVIYRNNKKIATIKSNKIKNYTVAKLSSELLQTSLLLYTFFFFNPLFTLAFACNFILSYKPT